MKMIRISRIRRYPIKGLAGEDLDNLTLTAGGGVPLDRRYALALPDRLLGLAEDASLARFSAAAAGDGRLVLYRDSVPVAAGRADRHDGMAELELVLNRHLGEIANPRIVPVEGGDAAEETKPISLISLAS